MLIQLSPHDSPILAVCLVRSNPLCTGFETRLEFRDLSETIKKVGVWLDLGRTLAFCKQLEVAMRFTVKVAWQQDDGTVATAELGELYAGGLRSATDLGLKLSDAKPILTRLQNIVTATQVSSYCESIRKMSFVPSTTKNQGL